MIAPRIIAKVGEIFTNLKVKLTADQQSFVVHQGTVQTRAYFPEF